MSIQRIQSSPPRSIAFFSTHRSSPARGSQLDQDILKLRKDLASLSAQLQVTSKRAEARPGAPRSDEQARLKRSAHTNPRGARTDSSDNANDDQDDANNPLSALFKAFRGWGAQGIFGPGDKNDDA